MKPGNDYYAESDSNSNRAACPTDARTASPYALALHPRVGRSVPRSFCDPQRTRRRDPVRGNGGDESVTVFQLIVHSCLIANFSDGSLQSADCKWEDHGLFKFEQTCKSDGIKQMGSGADGYRCLKLSVS